MKKSTLAFVLCLAFSVGLVFSPDLAISAGKSKSPKRQRFSVSHIKQANDVVVAEEAPLVVEPAAAEPQAAAEPAAAEAPVVFAAAENMINTPSPNAFGEPNPGTNTIPAITAVRGTRASGWVDQTRSEILARNGIVATSEPQAAMAGIKILQDGGNAIDAAVATMAMIALQEPQSTGIGGELFAIIYDAKTKQVYQISANGPTPKNSTVPLARHNNLSSVPYTGVWSAMIPGSPDGWDKMLKRFGTMTFKEVLEPARVSALEGFPVHQVVAGSIGGNGRCTGDPDTAAVYCPNGVAYGTLYKIFKNPQLANLFQTLQDKGIDAFYRGEIADAMVAKMNKAFREGVRSVSGSNVFPAYQLLPGMTEFVSKDDFANYSARWIEPLKTNYHGYDIYETPPPSQAWSALEMLNIIEVCSEQFGMNLRSIGRENPFFTHLQVEAKKLAYSDLHRYNADPRFARDLYDKINNYFNNKTYAASLCPLIDMGDPATGRPPKARNSDRFGNLPGGTIYGASADRWGNMVSFVYSVYDSFGSTLTVPGYGFQFSNRGAMFTLDTSHPNVLEGSKEPFITIMSAFIMKDGEPVMAIGNMGGSTQPLGHVQHFMNLIDLGFNVQATSDAARWDHSQSSNGTAQGTLSVDRYLYDHRCTPNYTTRACPAANLAVTTNPLTVTAPRIGDTLQSWGHSPSRSTGVGGGYEGIYFKKDLNEPAPCGGCYDGVLAKFNAGVCVTKADGTPLFPAICEARMKALENCDTVCKTYRGPVNGVYHGGADTLHKDAAAIGW